VFVALTLPWLPHENAVGRVFAPVIATICCTFGLFTALELLLSRVVVDDTGLRRYNAFNRCILHAKFAEIEAYRPRRQEWTVQVSGKAYPLGEISYPDLHPIVVNEAPRSLGAVHIKIGQLPPKEDFKGLYALDALSVLITLLRTIAFVALGLSVIDWKDRLASLWALAAVPLGISLPLMEGVFVTLDITTEGISVRWPGRSRHIPWAEVTAVFCEQKEIRRFFVVTSKEMSVTIPPHIAQDLDCMLKVYCSVPENTRFVNVDDSFRGGYRRRGKGRKVPAEPHLVPQLDPQMSSQQSPLAGIG